MQEGIEQFRLFFDGELVLTTFGWQKWTRFMEPVENNEKKVLPYEERGEFFFIQNTAGKMIM